MTHFANNTNYLIRLDFNTKNITINFGSIMPLTFIQVSIFSSYMAVWTMNIQPDETMERMSGDQTNHMTRCDFCHPCEEQCGTTFYTMSNNVKQCGGDQCQTMQCETLWNNILYNIKQCWRTFYADNVTKFQTILSHLGCKLASQGKVWLVPSWC